MEKIEGLEKSLSIAKAKKDKLAEIEAYRNLGGAYQSVGIFHEAVKYHTKGLNLAIQIGDKCGEEKAYGNLGIVHVALMKHDEGIAYLQKSLSIAKDLGDRKSEGLANLHLGNAFFSLKRFDEAVEFYQSFLRIVTEIGDKDGERVAYLNLGNAFSSSLKDQEANDCYKKHVSVVLEIGDKTLERDTYGNLGITFKEQGKYEEAVEYLEKCLRLAKDSGDLKIEANTYGHLGLVYTSLSRYQEATEYYEKCLTISKETGNVQEEAISLGCLGRIYILSGDYAKAIECSERCSQLALSIGDIGNYGKALGNLGDAQRSLGDYQNALDYYKVHLDIAQKLDDNREIQTAFGNLGSTYSLLGQYNEAVEYHTSCLALAEVSPDIRDVANCCARLGITYFSLGKYREAADFWVKELCISKEIGYTEGELAAYGNLANVLQLVGKHKEALQHSQKSLNLAKKIGDKRSEASNLNGLGKSYQLMGKLSKASECYQKTLALATEIGDKQTEGLAYVNLGSVYKASEKYEDAIQCCEKAVDILSRIGDRKAVAMAHFNIGMCYKLMHAKNHSKAKEHLVESIRCSEELYHGLGTNDTLKIPIVDTYIEAYKALTRLYLDTGDADEAILVSERGRGRALEDLLSMKYGVNRQNTPNSGSLELSKRGVYDIIDMTLVDFSILYFDVSPEKDSIQMWVPEAFPNPSFCVRRDVNDFQSSEDDCDEESSKEVNIQNVIEKSYEEMKVREVECEDRSLGILNATELETSACGIPTEPVPTESSTKEVSKRRCIFEVEEDEKPLVYLYEMLISPVEEKLIQDEVVIIPDGELFVVPFAALQDTKTGNYLSETKRIRLIPSLTILKILQESSNDQEHMSGALIVGNPDIGKVIYRGKERSFTTLHGAEDEANEIAYLLGVEALTRKKATKQNILERLQKGVSVVHFAAHGETENGQILLAPSQTYSSDKLPEEKDYILTINEAQESGLRAQLVVLSCCHSGKGDIRSEGVVGMARAFLASGARAVVASLWAIDDNATKFFMLKFYSHLIEGESASRSLQQAMKEMRESIYSDPMYWAAFFLIGDNVTISLEPQSDTKNVKHGRKCIIS